VLVIGAQGQLGRFMAEGLAAEGWNVLRGGRRPEAGEDFRLVDLDRPETLETACSGTDLVITTVVDDRLAAERWVLREGGRLLHIGSLPLAPRRALEAEAPGARGVVVLHTGLNPGVTTLMLKDMLARNPGVDRLEIAIAATVRQSGGPGGVAFLFDQLARERRRGVATVPFPSPIGTQPCFDFGRGEEGWFGGFADLVDCRARMYLGPRLVMAGLRVLNSIGGLRLLARAARRGRRRSSAPATREPKREWTAVYANGRRMAARTLEGEGDYAMTVAATLAFADALLDADGGRRALTGVHGGETIFDLHDILPGLEARGVEVVERDPATSQRAYPELALDRDGFAALSRNGRAERVMPPRVG
jgi:hypothetical protein